MSEDTDLRRKALQMAGIGILLFGMVCSGCDRKAQVNAEPESSEKIECSDGNRRSLYRDEEAGDRRFG